MFYVVLMMGHLTGWNYSAYVFENSTVPLASNFVALVNSVKSRIERTDCCFFIYCIICHGSPHFPKNWVRFEFGDST